MIDQSSVGGEWEIIGEFFYYCGEYWEFDATDKRWYWIAGQY